MHSADHLGVSCHRSIVLLSIFEATDSSLGITGLEGSIWSMFVLPAESGRKHDVACRLYTFGNLKINLDGPPPPK